MLQQQQDPRIILVLRFFGWKKFSVVLGTKTHLKKKEVHKSMSYPKIDFHSVHHQQILLEENFKEEIFLCYYYDHFRFACMNFGLASTPMVSSSFMRRESNKKLGYFTFSSLGSTVMHCRMLESHCLNFGSFNDFGVGQSLYDSLIECKVGEVGILLKQARWVPT